MNSFEYLKNQKLAICKFLNYIFDCESEIKNNPISLIKKSDGSIEYIFFNPPESARDYYGRVVELSKDSMYAILYIPDNTKNKVRIFFDFLDPKNKKYAQWFLSPGGLVQQ